MKLIGVIGLGFVGSAIYNSISTKISEQYFNEYAIIGYDKYKQNTNITLNECLNCDVLFLALPTSYCDVKKSYNYDSILEVCDYLNNNCFSGIIIIKSTIEPTYTQYLEKVYSKLSFIHNPEFLSSKTAQTDFDNQSHIVLGKSINCTNEQMDTVIKIYDTLYPNAEISVCNSTESECVKLFCNTFYAVKIQYFNELYETCQKIGCNYDNVVSLMLKNNWINPMHTKVPGSDGQLSYGGMCFPKDTHAMLEFMKNNNISHQVLEATVKERDSMRKD